MNILVSKLVWFAETFDFVSPAFHMLNTERRRHDVHFLFGDVSDVSYDVRNAHCKQWNKKKIYSFSVNTIKIFISCNENIQIFTRASHSWKYCCFHYTRWQYLWYSQQKSKYPLCTAQCKLDAQLQHISLNFEGILTACAFSPPS